MAGIDKTWVTWDEYLEVKAFFTKEKLREAKDFLGWVPGLPKYKKSDFTEETERTLWNSPGIFDLWLSQNTPPPCIIKRLKEQYPENWIGWKTLNLKETGVLISISFGDSYIAPFVSDENGTTFFDEVRVYGTCFAYKLLYTTLHLIANQYILDSTHWLGLKADFNIFGLDLKVEYKSGRIYFTYESSEVSLPYLELETLKKYMFYPKLVQSYSLKGLSEKHPGAIILSHEDVCFNPDVYKAFDKNSYKRYLSFLPKYTTWNIRGL